MSIDIKLWSDSFLQTELPSWPCPNCGQGRLRSDKSPKIVEPNYSAQVRSHDDFEPDWITNRFAAWMTCSDSQCGELVIVSGDSVIREIEDGEYGWMYASFLRPRSIFPAPPIIVVPEETPRAVKSEIEIAFQLFWNDLGSSASRLRTSVERLLDNFDIPKTRLQHNKKKNKKERVFRSLASRIDLFKKKKPGHAESFHALRHVGNLGTHSDVDRQSVLAGFEIYEEALAEIYGKRSKKLGRLVKSVIKGKGKLR